MGRKKKSQTEEIFDSIRKPIAPPSKIEVLKKYKQKYPFDTEKDWPVGPGNDGNK